MSTLYVTVPGARIEKEYHRILVTKNDEVLLRVPIERISDVVLVGRVGATTPAIHALLRAEVPLMFVGRTGKLLGKLLPPTRPNLPLRQIQFERNNDRQFCLDLARRIVHGKIGNQRTYAQRLARQHNEIDQSFAGDFSDWMSAALSAESLDTLRGIEGSAARRYFSIYRKAFDPGWGFNKRTRRPPKEPVNALLSLGYVFLGYAITAALEIVGLDPYLGYFHAEKYGRPALALDLVEEFRTPIVDSLALSLINRERFTQDDFISYGQKAPCVLNLDALAIFFDAFSEKLESEISLRELSRKLSYRKIFEVQARKMAKAISGEADKYEPFKMR